MFAITLKEIGVHERNRYIKKAETHICPYLQNKLRYFAQ
jgi:hypothetical protein